jgi:hypothetical protein
MRKIIPWLLTCIFIAAPLLTARRSWQSSLLFGRAQNDIREIHALWTSNWKVSTVKADGVPSCLVTFSSKSYPIFQTSSSVCGTFGAAVLADSGKIAAFSHNGFIRSSENPILYKNLITWLSGEKNTSSSEIINLDRIAENVFTTMNLNSIKLLIWTTSKHFQRQDSIDKIEKFIRNGGGLLAAYPAWVWTTYNGFDNVKDTSMNKLLSKFGIFNANDYLEGDYPSIAKIPSVGDINIEYATLANTNTDQQFDLLSYGINHVPLELLESSRIITQYFATLRALSFRFPLKSSEGKTKLYVSYLSRKYDSLESPEALPYLESVPGVVRSSARTSVNITVTKEQKESWLSTGIYFFNKIIICLYECVILMYYSNNLNFLF